MQMIQPNIFFYCKDISQIYTFELYINSFIIFSHIPPTASEIRSLWSGTGVLLLSLAGGPHTGGPGPTEVDAICRNYKLKY